MFASLFVRQWIIGLDWVKVPLQLMQKLMVHLELFQVCSRLPSVIVLIFGLILLQISSKICKSLPIGSVIHPQLTYLYTEQKIWGCRLVESQFSQLVSTYGNFQENFFIIRDLQVYKNIYDIRFMLCLRCFFPCVSFLAQYTYKYIDIYKYIKIYIIYIYIYIYIQMYYIYNTYISTNMN